MINLITTYIDVLIISTFILIIEFIFFIKTKSRINNYENYFQEINFDDKDIISYNNDHEIRIIKSDKLFINSNFCKVIEKINNYLIKNKGVVDFDVLKNILEREIKAIKDDASNNVTLPLYIGLMGTFFGIVFGLSKIAFSGGITDSNINTFLGGVIIAMIASLFGLLLTVLNTFYFFRKANIKITIRKNNFLNFLQTELLPFLQSNLYQALNILRVNINSFNDKFEKNIGLFDDKFAINISNLKSSVDKMSIRMNQVVENTNTQRQFLKEFKSFKYSEIIASNNKLLEQISESGPLLSLFIERQKQLNATLESSGLIVSAINDILNRVKSFEESINNLGESINSNEFLGNEVLKKIKTNLDYLNDQYELLKKHSETSSERINEFFKAEFNTIEILTVKIRQEITRALDFNIENNPFQKLNRIDEIIENLNAANIKDNLRDLKIEMGSLKDYIANLSLTELLNHTQQIENKIIDKDFLNDLIKNLMNETNEKKHWWNFK